jgi:hypothetical protein
MRDYVSIGFEVVDDVEWDEEETSDAVLHAQEEDNWTLTKEQLALFAKHKVSIPPKVPEIARLLAEIRK